jgi:hypothetical protein
VWDEEKQMATLFDVESDPRELAEVSAANPKVTERLLGLLRAQRDIDATFRERASGPPRSYELSPADIEELRKLGYMGPEAPDPSAAPRWLPLPRLGR